MYTNALDLCVVVSFLHVLYPKQVNECMNQINVLMCWRNICGFLLFGCMIYKKKKKKIFLSFSPSKNWANNMRRKTKTIPLKHYEHVVSIQMCVSLCEWMYIVYLCEWMCVFVTGSHEQIMDIMENPVSS